jgi:hypothetical protein
LHVYDIASAYPAALVEFPSLASGEWINKKGKEIACGSLLELRAAIEAVSPVSMFKIRFQFPAYENTIPIHARPSSFHFIRCPTARIGAESCSPQADMGWYTRDDVLAAIIWLEHFPEFPRSRKSADKITRFDVEEAWIFVPRDGGSRK